MNATRNKINAIFDRLDVWRHLPSYQLERRADIFLSLYLIEIISATLNVQLHDWLIPEFPIRYGEKIGNKGENQSWKVDYVAQSKDNKKLFLIELKTDPQSRNKAQDNNLQKLVDRNISMAELIAGILMIFKVTKQKHKYLQLLATLGRYHLVKLDDIAKRKICEPDKPLRGINAAIKKTRILASANTSVTRIVYLQPSNLQPTNKKIQSTVKNTSIITFADAAKIIELHPDNISERLAESLRTWEHLAGCPNK